MERYNLLNLVRRRLGEHALALLLVLNVFGLAASSMAGPWTLAGLLLASIVLWSLPLPKLAHGGLTHVSSGASGLDLSDDWFEKAKRAAKIFVALTVLTTGAGIIWITVNLDIDEGWLFFSLLIPSFVMISGGLYTFFWEAFGVELEAAPFDHMAYNDGWLSGYIAGSMAA